jgi:hypothetical protein
MSTIFDFNNYFIIIIIWIYISFISFLGLFCVLLSFWFLTKFVFLFFNL